MCQIHKKGLGDVNFIVRHSSTNTHVPMGMSEDFHMRISKSKSGLIFGVLALFIAAIGFFNLKTASLQRGSAVLLSENSLPSVSRVNEIKLNVTRLRLAELDYVSTSDLDKRAALKLVFEECLQNIFIYKKTYEPLLENSPDQLKQFEKFATEWDKYSAVHEKIVAAADKNSHEEAEASIDSSDPLFESMSTIATVLSNYHFDAAIERTKLAGVDYETSKWLLGSFSALSVILVLLGGAFVRKESQNQLGPMAVATTVSSEKIMASVDVLVNSTYSLNEGATESAASLEETVAAMEELASLVKVNSETAQRAAALSVESQASVAVGQTQIQGMIENIKDVYQSSKKISEILILIEDIAFQTNLLALNAAVEAARAGEHGKGFAVVADAVRSLAQNSSKSAKEISQLINISSEKTENGMKIAASSEKSLNEIVTSVSRVSNLIQDISSAAQEQHLGINQITTALTQIDQAIQLSVASTENISGLSNDLQHQAMTLGSLAVNLREFAAIKDSPKLVPDQDVLRIDNGPTKNQTLKAS